MLHPLLARQLKRCGIENVADSSHAEAWLKLLERVGQAYREADEERYLLERSLSTVSTEMLEINASLRASLATIDDYRAALDRAAIISVTDVSGTITEVNEPFCRISGYSREELIGANQRIVKSDHHPRAFWADMWETVTRGEVWRNEVCNRAKDGRHYWVDTTIGPVRDAQGTIRGYISIRQDITERKYNERELILARSSAERANRAKSEFLANMSHEIRTPMTAILGYADILREECEMGLPPQTGMIETIRSAGAHLMSLLNDILDLSKLDAGKMTIENVPTSLTHLIREVGNLTRPSAERMGLSLVVRLDSPLPECVLTDPTRLRQILMNLVSNAIKFTEAGAVTMAARTASREGVQRLLIDVEDTGAGLAPDQSARLFAPFTQGDNTMTRKFGGTGLGLTISRRLAQLMGGNVTLIRTQQGVGSCFGVDLPLVPVAESDLVESLDPATSRPNPASLAPAASLRGHILLAEDGRDNQRLISLFLRRAGATVDIADHGKVALEMLDKAEAEGKPYDLLLTDMQMPEMDGYTLARTLRTRGSQLAIVALTAHTMAGDRDMCLAAGCDDYTSKPVDKQDLLSKCAIWMGGLHSIRPDKDGSTVRERPVVP